MIGFVTWCFVREKARGGRVGLGLGRLSRLILCRSGIQAEALFLTMNYSTFAAWRLCVINYSEQKQNSMFYPFSLHFCWAVVCNGYAFLRERGMGVIDLI